MLIAVLIANALWFGAGFWHFTFKARGASFGIVAKTDATPAARAGLIGSLRFLGGLNLALAANCSMLAIHIRDAGRVQILISLATFAIAHASQFAVNVPVVLREMRGEQAPWRVFGSLMLLIFVVDGVLAVVDSIVYIAVTRTG